MSGDTISHLTGKMLELTALKKKQLEEIHRSTKDQSGLLTPEKTGEQLALIAKKQEMMVYINKLDGELLLLENKILNIAGLSSWAAGKKVLGEKWNSLENTRQDIVLILRETQRLDEINRLHIRKEHQILKKNMQALYVKRSSVRVYQGSAAQSDGFFIDKNK